MRNWIAQCRIGVVILFLFFTLFTNVEAGTTLKIRVPREPVDFEWTSAGNQLTYFIFTNIMSGLTELDENLKPHSALAKSVSVSDGGRLYVFLLDPKARWSNGQVLRAEDFVTAWKRLLSPITRRPFASLLYSVEGAQDYAMGKITDFSKVAIVARQPNILEVKLKAPQSNFLKILATPATFPIPTGTIEDATHKPWKNFDALVTLGRYRPKSYQRGKLMTLVRNPTFFGGPANLDEIQIQVIDDDSTAIKMFKAGETDLALSVRSAEVARVGGGLEKFLHHAPQYRTRFIGFNPEKFPFNFVEARKAVAMSIERSKLKYLEKDNLSPAPEFVPNELLNDQGEQIAPNFDPKAAKEMFQNAGVNPNGALHLELAAVSSDQNALATTEIAEQIQRNLGIKVDVTLVPLERFTFNLSLRASPLYYLVRGAEFPDRDAFLGPFMSDSDLNALHFKNSKYDQALTHARSLEDGPVKTAAYRQALRILIKEEVALIPLHFEGYNYLLSSKFTGLKFFPTCDISFEGARAN